MRLLTLDLLRYGHFETRCLALPRVPLTVIHGRNEAGKSTVLHAIDDLLFGIPERTAHDFRFDGPALRLGAEIEAADGTRLAFRRRKGRKGTLLDPAESPLDDATLDRFLGGCSRALFHDLFGLDAARLRDGGRRLLKDGGALGESLLGAGAALRDAAALRRALEADADRLYSPRKAGRRAFWQARDAFDVARAALREQTRPPEALRAAEAAHAEAAAQLGRTRATLETLEGADRADTRLAAALPIVARLDALRRERAGLADLDGAAPELADSLDAALQEASAARAADAALAERRDALAARRRDQPRPSALLERRGAIEALKADAAAAVAAAAERAEATRALAAAQGRLDAVAAALGLDPARFEALGPSLPALAEARARLTEGTALAAARDAAAERAATLARGRDRLPEPPDTPDPAPARAALERLRDLPARLRRAAELRDAAAAAQAEAGAAARALSPAPACGLDAFAPPPAAALDAAAARWAALRDRGAALAADRAALARERDALDAAATPALDAVPDRAALDAARAARDAGWRAIRRVRLEGGAGEAPQPDAYERLVADADRLADRREAAATAIEAEAQARAARERLDRRAAALEAEAAALARDEATAHRDWAALWPDLAAPPLAPEAMRGWLAERERALLLARRAAAQTQEATTATGQTEAERHELDALASAWQLGPTPSPAAAIDALDRALAAAEAAREARRQRATAAQTASEAAAEAERASARWADWSAGWAGAAPALGLSPQDGPAGASAALDLWAEVPALRERRAALTTRIAALDRAASAFAEAARAEAAQAGLPPDPDPSALVRRLAERLDADIAADLHHTALDREAAAQAQEAAVLAARSAAAAEAVAAVGRSLGLDDADPAALLGRLRARSALDAALAAESARLRELDLLTDEAALRTAATGLDPDTLAARIAARRAEKAAAQSAHEAAVRAEAEATLALRRHDDEAAARARQARDDAAAAMAQAAGEWLRVRAALLLLAEATRRYREANRDPLLAEAGAALARITGGSLAGLDVELDDDDTERLVALRPDGTRLSVEALSEGARDQLFLALRIAAVARRCAVAEPVPFIADDLFSSFDEPRAAAGLAELSRLGETTQVLVFTHHAHVAEQAEGLGPAAAVLRL